MQIAMADDPVIWTEQRKELRDWFRRNAPSLLSLYEGCVLLLDSPNPSRHHFIASAVRDIINLLPQIIGAGRLAPRLDYAKQVSAIAEHWPVATLINEESSSGDSVGLSASAYLATEELIVAHRNTPPQRKRTEFLLRALLERQSLDSNVPIDLLVDAIGRIFRWCGKWKHGSHEMRTPPTDLEIAKQVHNFEQSLHVIVGQFFYGTAELDAILQATNAK
jgi:hypothetical protein